MPETGSELNSLVDFFGKSLKIDKSNEARLIIEQLKKCPGMTALRLAGNTFGVEASAAIGAELRNHKNLSKCFFSDMFTGRLVDEIAPSLTNLSVGMIAAGAHLTELDLSDNAFGPRGVVGVTELLSSPVCYSLKLLKMNNQGLGHQGCRFLAEALSKGLTESGGKGPKLSYFSAGRNRLENVGAMLLAEVFSKMASLEELHLYQNGIGIHGMDGIRSLADAISRNTNMRVLNLSDNSLTADGGIEIAKKLSFLPRLEDLILDDCLIRSKGCRALAKSLSRAECVPQLRSLSLYGNEITRGAGVNLVLAVSDKVGFSRLNLNANEFGTTGIEMILSTLESVGMLHVLELSAADEDERDSSIISDVDAFHQAFSEDQGSDPDDGEEDEDGSSGGDYHQEDDELDESDLYREEDDEYTDSPSSFPGYDESRSGNSSFDTVKQHSLFPPVNLSNNQLSPNEVAADLKKTAPFSFRSCINDLRGDAPPLGRGLFAGVDITDASACRSKLWMNATNSPSPFGALFTPPRLGGITSLSSAPSAPATLLSHDVVDSKSNDAEILDLLKKCLLSLEDDSLVKSLCGKLSFGNCSFSDGTLDSFFDSPEIAVRFAFRLTRLPSPSDASKKLALRSLVSAFTSTTCCPRNELISQSGRAVNHILVHLGAVKPDRDDSLERRVAAESSNHVHADFDLLNALLSHHGSRLPESAQQSLALLLKQHRVAHPPPPSVAGLLDGVLDMLESKLGALSVS